MDVRRRALLDRLRRARPQLVTLVAPAGFGKSVLARQFAAGFRVRATCDCAGDFTGRFNIETFIVAPGVAPAPLVFKSQPFPDAGSNPATPPVQIAHLGLWFNSPNGAAKAGCASTVTPFNGTHNAGIQAMNTGTFKDLEGPLLQVR